MFFSVLALAGLLMTVLPYRRFRQISTIVQFAVLTTLVMLLFLTPEIGSLVGSGGGSGRAVVNWLPTVWFLGLYQALSSAHASANFGALTIRAIFGLSTAAGASLCFWIASYQRVFLRIPEIAEGPANGQGKLAKFKEDLSQCACASAGVRTCVLSLCRKNAGGRFRRQCRSCSRFSFSGTHRRRG